MAEAAARLGLKHVVITSVTRDDLPDGGAEHFYRACWPCGERTGAAVEVLTPDFLGKPGRARARRRGRPGSLQSQHRNRAAAVSRVRGRKTDYRWTLELLRRVKQRNPAIKTKSGLMLGLGETRDELFDVLADLRDAGCDFLTLGQYLQPTPDSICRSSATCRRRSSTSWARRPADGLQQRRQRAVRAQ